MKQYAEHLSTLLSKVCPIMLRSLNSSFLVLKIYFLQFLGVENVSFFAVSLCFKCVHQSVMYSTARGEKQKVAKS